ncbi:7,8-didemethyl-8-hydroxy-5-deazariboflavin synthase CofG [Agreia sp. COWG]|uniref:7,8-didemethyl-8-hydroxy-5-deazariboflavin synthase CofG n=1 Tax=Agreia sp. COWG TaxID=2773266 RepID=UPI0019255CAF|nr:7,8-didemethyl-8-hydroxy-5-deazariboflavin synthase CofG [Agreia sp. COWG]CAD6003289.1 7,8-didemethyl-8-hydroxy-5-deazariboflavin synthase / 5-amino-6-(D-ribitylamino)uracil--L-tyrosine 4-hydroxyphenyl transferase [Agreia sp. COWG]
MTSGVAEPSLDEIRGALDRLESGAETTPIDAELLFSARGHELGRLLAVSARLRDEGLERSGRAGVITYSKKVFIPVTHLCQDRCHYCIFVETPAKLATKGKPIYMSPDEILEVARAGAAMGCKEALFTLGDRPENRWPVARQWLDEHGYASTIDYIRAMAKLVLEETGLLPHLNPGVMSWSELQLLRPVAPSMGMMLETTATRLWSEKGGVHYGSPDKDPALRLRVLDDAGRSKVPFTTGVLLGIGENNAERAEALFEIRASHERYGHIQETIVQNFRAKPRTAMQNEVDLALEEYVAAVAVARVVMGPDATVQAPPNLTDAKELGLLLRAGIDDWGGVSPLTADHVNPERPWPELDTLAGLTRDAGFELVERLTAHPPFVNAADEWIDPRIRTHLEALAAASGLAREDAPVEGRPWAAAADVRSDAGRPPRLSAETTAALNAAEASPASLSDAEYIELLGARGPDLDALTSLANDVRRDAVGDDITFVINRNIDSSLYGADPARGGLGLDSVLDLADEAADLGATELCIQGAIPQHMPATAYLDLVSAIHARRPELHLHAFRPTEIRDGADRLGLSLDEYLLELRTAGVDSVPGTGARILDDRLRGILSEHTDPPAERWISAMEAAHRAGLRSTASMVYGHLETPAEQLAHLRAIAAMQDRTGGFTEFIAMPFVAVDAPASVALQAGPGPDRRQSRALHAVARLILHGHIDHLQAAWTKLGLLGSQEVLGGGADDLGGLLLDGILDATAGAEAHRSLSIADMERTAAEIGRNARQRTTSYGEPTAAQLAHARRIDAPPATRLQLPISAVR